MSEAIKHECGIAMIRLRKPLGYYIEKYGTPAYAINKLFLLMEKQHNRGQDGAGVASVKIGPEIGDSYIDLIRSVEKQPIADIFERIGKKFTKIRKKNKKDPSVTKAHWLKQNVPFTGELLMGHLRYGTYGRNDISYCHPVYRPSNWRGRNLLMAGNFNMTNNSELIKHLIQMGQHPVEHSDTVTVLEKVGHFLDREHQQLLQKFEDTGQAPPSFIEKMEDEIDLKKVVERSCKDFDGGYAMMGATGYGASFIARDPSGIRPAYFFANEEVIVAASEKPAIKIAFDVDYDEIQEIPNGHALIIDRYGNYSLEQVCEQKEKRSCSFERIYFSRGTDPSIYSERKALGRLLCEEVLKTVDQDLINTVFSYIPNTAETAFLGMMKGMEAHLIKKRVETLKDQRNLSEEQLYEIFATRARVEKLVIKDTKLRTFITGDDVRDDFVAHVYDTTYGIIREDVDTVVVIDDSIVRGTTLEQSILRMLDRLNPKKIVIVSSAPQIRFPDCYGIDMSKMQDFIAFRAVLELLKDHQLTYLLDEVYHKCIHALENNSEENINHVKALYAPFTYEQVSKKIAEMLKRKGKIKAAVEVVYQSVELLHKACPEHIGDWYFTGNYPTPGGTRVVNKSFVNFMEGRSERAY